MLTTCQWLLSIDKYTQFALTAAQGAGTIDVFATEGDAETQGKSVSTGYITRKWPHILSSQQVSSVIKIPHIWWLKNLGEMNEGLVRQCSDSEFCSLLAFSVL